MKIVPTRIEDQINRVDPTRSRVIGIAAAITAAWCAYRLLWLVYLAATISSVGWSPGVAGLPVRAVGRDLCRRGNRGRRLPDQREAACVGACHRARSDLGL